MHLLHIKLLILAFLKAQYFQFLFLIYINDLPNALHTIPRLFADDTCLFLNHSSLTSLENICAIEVSRLKDWCNANKIQINSQKLFILPISPKLNVPSLNLNLTEIPK